MVSPLIGIAKITTNFRVDLDLVAELLHIARSSTTHIDGIPDIHNTEYISQYTAFLVGLSTSSASPATYHVLFDKLAYGYALLFTAHVCSQLGSQLLGRPKLVEALPA